MRSARPAPAALLIAAAQSLLLTQVPLLNVLGLEFAAATAPLIALLSGWSVVREQASEVSWSDLLSASIRGLLLSMVPLVVGSAAALFIRNCSLLVGLRDYLLVVPPAAVFGVGLATLARGLIVGWPRTTFALLWLAVLSQIVIVTFAQPQIYAFNPVVGFFPGFSYDDALGLPGSLWAFRVVTLAAAVTLMGLGRMLILTQKQGWNCWRSRTGVLTTFAVLTVILVWWQADRWGWASSLGRIERELQGRRESEHFIVLYPADKVTEEQADRLVAFHEFTFERLRRTLRVWPGRKITSVLYRDAAQKNRLTGGGRTNFTKPWLMQMHLLQGDVRGSLRHEMVHVLAEEFGLPVLGIGVNAGVIEGLAVALDRTTNGESVHRAAAQILSTGSSVAVEDLFTPTGFFRANPSVSYTLAGSFSRYLIERFGIRGYKTFYRTGDSHRAFFHQLPDLVAGWRRRIDAIPLERSDSLKAAYYYRRPPIYTRECLRVIGELNGAARRAFGEGSDSSGASMAERSWSLSRTPEAAALRVQGLARLGRSAFAVAFIDSLRADAELWPSVQTLDLQAGDAWWRMDSLVAAGAAYQRLLEANISLGWSEAAAVRWEGLVQFGWDRRAVEALIGVQSDSVKRRLWESILEENRVRRRTPLLQYALARTVSLEREPAEVIRLLAGSVQLGRPVLNYTARRRLASAYVVVQDWERAKAALWESLNYTDNEAEMLDVSDAIAYCDWLKERSQK